MDVATSNNTAISSSSRLSISKSSSPNNSSNSKQSFVEERSYELNSLYAESSFPGPHRMTRFSRISRSFANWNPRVHEWITKAALYVRGPRPKVDLVGTRVTPCFQMPFRLTILSVRTLARYRHPPGWQAYNRTNRVQYN